MKTKITLLIALLSLFLNLESIQAQTPEILYYNFNGVGTNVPNQALTPPVGAENATVMGGITLGGVGQCETTALMGSGNSSSSDYLNTNWNTNLGSGSWTISFWSSGFPNSATLYYIFGDDSASAFRCFTNGVAGANNWILRGGGLTDVLINGGAIATPTMNTFVYDNVANNVKAYLNGVLVNTVPQGPINITGLSPFKVMGYGTNVGAPAGGLLDEFRMYNRALSDAEILSLSTASTLLPPTVTTPITYTQGATATPLTATGTGLLWYTSSSGGTGDTNAPTPSTTALGTTSYWVSQTSTCGEGPRAQIDVTIAAAGPASALNFDGIDDRVSMPNQPVSNLTNFTLEAWVKTSDNNSQAIYSEGNSSDDNPMFSLIKNPNTSGFEIVLRNEFGIGLVVSSTIGYVPLNTWTHVTFSRTSASTASLYINGVNTDNFTFTDPGSIVVNVANIGVRQRVNFDGFFNGSIDEVRIWNRTLPQTEIANNMNCELGASQTGLLAYYKFNQGIDNADNTAITSLTDFSGNNNNGTLNNFTLNGPISNWVNPGGVSTGSQCTTASALNFDGFDDYVNCGNSPLLNITGSLSVEAFINRSTLNTDDCIIGKDIFATSTGYSFWVYQNNRLIFRLGNREFQSVSTINQNTWTHVAATFDAGIVKLYINGVLDATYTGIAPPVSNTNGLFLGTPQDAVGNSIFAFSGKMDEVRIWNRSLEQCEIQNNMNGELSAGQTGLLAYYQFNQGIDSQDNTAITNLADLSGNNFNGTLSNFALNGPTSNWVNTGGVITNSISPTYDRPNVNVVTSQSVCNNSTTTPIIFSSSTTGTVCGQTNEGGTINLAAPVGAVFTSIPFASYGTPDGTCGNYTLSGCHASNSISVVSASALGQNNFSILANNGAFGDPCAFVGKRMYIQAVYNNTIFNWTNNTPSIGLAASGTGNIPSFTATNSGSTPVVATIIVTPMINGCVGTPIQFTITVNPTAAPTGSSTQVINGGVAADATIEDIVVNPTTVIWYASSSDALAGTNALLAGTQLIDGAEYFAVNQENGCTSTPLAVTVTVVLGNDTFDMSSFNLYPNPTSDVVTLQYSKEISEISVLNLLGQTMLNKKLNATETTIDFSNLPSATYFVKVVSEGNIKMVKVIKR